jgi:hypothetical protein
MTGRLRSAIQRRGVMAALICALSLAGLGTSRAAPSNRSGIDESASLPCNDVCKAYMVWSDRVSTMFHPSRPVAQAVVHQGKPAGLTVRHRASQPRQPGLSSFAQFPVRSDATAQSADTAQAEETEQAEVAPSRPVDGIAGRFPAAAGFATALLAGNSGASTDAPESATDAVPATRGASTIDGPADGWNIRFAVSLFLGLSTLSTLVLWGRSRGRTRIARAPR